MNKLEVGMYVRYNTLSNKIKIAKIIEIDDKNILDLDNKDCTNEKYIIGQPSYNIIDLIEFGDYVNGLEVYETGTFGHNGKRFCRLYGNVAPFFNSDIKSIITKEMFEQMKYEIGDDDLSK